MGECLDPFPAFFSPQSDNSPGSFVGKDVVEPLVCCMQGEADTPEESSEVIMKDNILNFSRQNSKLRVAEEDFERLIKSKDDVKQLYRMLSDGGGSVTLLKIEVRS
jgi:hypothetical protein